MSFRPGSDYTTSGIQQLLNCSNYTTICPVMSWWCCGSHTPQLKTDTVHKLQDSAHGRRRLLKFVITKPQVRNETSDFADMDTNKEKLLASEAACALFCAGQRKQDGQSVVEFVVFVTSTSQLSLAVAHSCSLVIKTTRASQILCRHVQASLKISGLLGAQRRGQDVSQNSLNLMSVVTGTCSSDLKFLLR